MAKLALIAGDTAPTRLIYKDAKTGAAIDISGYTITLTIGYKTGGLSKTAALVADVAGAFEFEWAEGDLVVGTYPAEIIVTDGDGKIKTHPIGEIIIGARIPVAAAP
jgi:hypothetical protein